MEPSKVLLIPKDIHKKLTLTQVLKPTPELFRVTLHQNELAVVFILLDIPKDIPMKMQSFFKSIEAKYSFSINNVSFLISSRTRVLL